MWRAYSALSFPLEVARKRLTVGMLQGNRPTDTTDISRKIIEEGVCSRYIPDLQVLIQVYPNTKRVK